MKKTLLTLVLLLGLKEASKAQALQIVNNRNCDIMVNINANGPCFGTTTCDLPTGAVFTIVVPAISSTIVYPDIASASSGLYSCSVPYEYVRAGIQNTNDCDICSGGGITVGEPCIVSTGFGVTCYSGTDCPPTLCADFTRPWGAGSALITVW